MEGRERLRLFVALLLPPSVLVQLADWQERAFRGVRNVRVVPRENLHLTLAFLGGRPADELPAIVEVVRSAAGGIAPPVFEPVRYRETRSVGMIALTDLEGRATRLAEALFDGLEGLGVYERERRQWLPHVTVVRFRQPPRLTPELPGLGQVMSSEVAVMMSRLGPSGSQYEVLESVSLGG